MMVAPTMAGHAPTGSRNPAGGWAQVGSRTAGAVALISAKALLLSCVAAVIRRGHGESTPRPPPHFLIKISEFQLRNCAIAQSELVLGMAKQLKPDAKPPVTRLSVDADEKQVRAINFFRAENGYSTTSAALRAILQHGLASGQKVPSLSSEPPKAPTEATSPSTFVPVPTLPLTPADGTFTTYFPIDPGKKAVTQWPEDPAAFMPPGQKSVLVPKCPMPRHIYEQMQWLIKQYKSPDGQPINASQVLLIAFRQYLDRELAALGHQRFEPEEGSPL